MLVIGIVQWYAFDGLADTFEYEFKQMGHQPIKFFHTEAIPTGLDLILSFAPYGRLYPIARKIGQLPRHSRPVFIHWASENIPDPRIPKTLTLLLARVRTLADRAQDSSSLLIQKIAATLPLRMVNNRFHRFRHIADYRDAYRNGWLDVLADVSALYVNYFNAYGIPAVYVPWGTSSLWYKDLALQRDIGVLWMGKRRTRHRSQLIDSIEREMLRNGIDMYIADGEKKPFIYNEERTEIINRSLITLNLQYVPYIVTLPLRFGVVAGNKSMILAEEMPPHSPEIIPGKHYVSTNRKSLVEQILFYLNQVTARNRIVEEAYQLATTQLTMQKSLDRLVNEAINCRSHINSPAYP